MIKQEYFLGTTSPTGFRTDFKQQIDRPGMYTYILKGGPGTGKSTLMKRIAESFDGENISLYRCSSDINSLDAAVMEDKNFMIVDGTAPHVFEADLPGISQEIINLGAFWDGNKLCDHADAVRYCFAENGKYHRRVRYYAQAISALCTDIYEFSAESLDRLKLAAYAERLAKKLIHDSIGKKGKTEYRQLSALTTDNYKTLPIEGDLSRYFIRDDNLAGGDMLLRMLSEKFTQSGYDVIISKFNMLDRPSYEHMICRQLGLSFTTGNFFNKQSPSGESIINFTRFYKKDELDRKKQRINFDKKASLELADEAAASLKIALDIHDRLEKFYIASLDINRINEMTEKFIDKLKNKTICR